MNHPHGISFLYIATVAWKFPSAHPFQSLSERLGLGGSAEAATLHAHPVPRARRSVSSACPEWRPWLAPQSSHTPCPGSGLQALVSSKLSCTSQPKIPLAINLISFCLRNKPKRWRQCSHLSPWTAEVAHTPLLHTHRGFLPCHMCTPNSRHLTKGAPLCFSV